MSLSWARLQHNQTRTNIYQISLSIASFGIAERLRRTVISTFAEVTESGTPNALRLQQWGAVVSVEMTRGFPPPVPVTMVGESVSSARDLLWLQRVPFKFGPRTVSLNRFASQDAVAAVDIDTNAERRDDNVPGQLWLRWCFGVPAVMDPDPIFFWSLAATTSVLIEVV